MDKTEDKNVFIVSTKVSRETLKQLNALIDERYTSMADAIRGILEDSLSEIYPKQPEFYIKRLYRDVGLLESRLNNGHK